MSVAPTECVHGHLNVSADGKARCGCILHVFVAHANAFDQASERALIGARQQMVAEPSGIGDFAFVVSIGQGLEEVIFVKDGIEVTLFSAFGGTIQATTGDAPPPRDKLLALAKLIASRIGTPGLPTLRPN
jgi:hypothetical protein